MIGVHSNLEKPRFKVGDDLKVGLNFFVIFTSNNKTNLTKLSALYTIQHFLIQHDTCSSNAFARVTTQQRIKCKRVLRSKNFKHVKCGVVN